MYQKRFGDEEDCDGFTIQQLRGKEGARTRDNYQKLASQFGIDWKGRNYNPENWNSADVPNRCLSAANTCLYGICHAGILSLGYSPALGFIHTGNQRSFVFDIADLYKTEITVPIAFEVASTVQKHYARKTRLACRDIFHERKMLNTIVNDINELLFFADTKTSSGDESQNYTSHLWEQK